jgi:glycosyltransferase involved in cell wall biosynthesis
MLTHWGHEMTRPKCSVVVCTRGRPSLLERCLASLTALDHPSYEVVVVDNTAGDPETRRIAEDGAARYLTEPRPGLSRARNAGGRAAFGDAVAFTDDDAVASPGWLSAHTTALDGDPTLSATTGRILLAPPDEPGPRAYAAVGGEDLGTDPFRVDRTTPDWFERANFGGVGVGPNMALRRSLFDEGWGFPEHLGPPHAIAGEEHFAFFDLIRTGHAIAYVPDALVHHYCVRTIEDVNRRKARIVRGLAAYSLMLLVEEPGYRVATLRYLVKAARGTRRDWRTEATEQRFATQGTLIRAAAAAPIVYIRSRVSDR